MPLSPSAVPRSDFPPAAKAKYQEREFQYRGRKKPVIKPPPPMEEASSPLTGTGVDFPRSLFSSGNLSHGMMEYIGFVNITLGRGKDLVPAGFVGQVRDAWPTEPVPPLAVDLRVASPFDRFPARLTGCQPI